MSFYTKVYNHALNTEFYISIENLNRINDGTIIHVITNINEPRLILGYYSDFNIKYCSLVTDKNIIAMLDKVTVFQ